MDSLFRVAWQPYHSTICVLTATISSSQLQDCFLQLPAAFLADLEQIDKGFCHGLFETSHVAQAIYSL
jgi:hypothetical protein